MRIGSMFSGLLGGLDIACERVFNAETAWQLDITGASVRRRHWPDAVQVEADVRTVDPADLARVDVLCGGFPCQDLSVAGNGEGLDGARSGLYRHMLRFADAMQPQFVVFENVSPLLNVLDVLAADLRRSGYGLTYAVCEAADAGLPHLRRRVFVLAERGVAGRGRVEVDASRRWSAVESEREWATISASNVNEGETPESWEARRQLNLAKHKNGNGQGEPLAMQVRENALGWGKHGRVSKGGMSHASTTNGSEEDAVRLLWGTGAAQAISRRVLGVSIDVPSTEVLQLAMRRAWSSESGAVSERHRQAADSAEEAVVRGLRERGATWDASQGRRQIQQLVGELGDTLRVLSHNAALARREGDADQVAAVPSVRQEVEGIRVVREALSEVEEVGRSNNREGQPAHGAAFGRRLNPAFVEALMGVPQGWTEPTGPNLRDQLNAWRAPRGRYPATWDRSVPWPGFAWEPSRTLPDGPPAPGRPVRIKGLGNGVVWQQAVLGLDACVNGCATGQLALFGAAK